MSIPRIYIACLSSYNNGYLHGDWVDLDGTEDLNEAIENIMLTSPMPDAEEWAVHDHEYCGSLTEYPGMDALNGIIEAFEKCQASHIEWEAFIGFCEHLGEEPTIDQVSPYNDAFAGSGKSLEDWCEELLEDTGQLSSVPDSLRGYFNFRAYARDMEVNDVFTLDHGSAVLVFWRH